MTGLLQVITAHKPAVAIEISNALKMAATKNTGDKHIDEKLDKNYRRRKKFKKPPRTSY